MQRLLPLFAASALTMATASAQQTVLDFENLSGFAPIAAGYGGVADWGSWAASDLPDPNYPAASGVVKILSVGLQSRIQFGQDVIFEGANVVSALPFSWRMFYQGAVVAESVVLQPNTGGPAVWLDSGYAGLVDELEYVSAVNVHGVDDFTYTVPQGSLGTSFCPANANSTGLPGLIEAAGSDLVADNNVTLSVSQIPANEFGIFVVGTAAAGTSVVNQGVLCITGPTGRYTMPGQIWQADAGGTTSLAIDLTMIPTPSSLVATSPGDTWFFQAWHRDVPPAGAPAGSNFTTGVEITFN